MSHPVWVRGLKQNQYEDIKKLREVAPRVGAWIETSLDMMNLGEKESHPVWVRGLKLPRCRDFGRLDESHPVWVRGLKLAHKFVLLTFLMSHPVWVRGLKQRLIMLLTVLFKGRTPCGCVD